MANVSVYALVCSSICDCVAVGLLPRLLQLFVYLSHLLCVLRHTFLSVSVPFVSNSCQPVAVLLTHSLLLSQWARSVAQHPEFLRGGVTTRWVENGAVLSTGPLCMEVIEGGTCTSVQDWPPRLGYWGVGLPPSGPMDCNSLRTANACVGNHPHAAALECTMNGPAVRFNTDTILALVGAPTGVCVCVNRPSSPPAPSESLLHRYPPCCRCDSGWRGCERPPHPFEGRLCPSRWQCETRMSNISRGPWRLRCTPRDGVSAWFARASSPLVPPPYYLHPDHAPRLRWDPWVVTTVEM